MPAKKQFEQLDLFSALSDLDDATAAVDAQTGPADHRRGHPTRDGTGAPRAAGGVGRGSNAGASPAPGRSQRPVELGTQPRPAPPEPGPVPGGGAAASLLDQPSDLVRDPRGPRGRKPVRRRPG